MGDRFYLLSAVGSFLFYFYVVARVQEDTLRERGAGFRDEQRNSSIAPLSPYGFPLPIFFPSPTHLHIIGAFERRPLGEVWAQYKALFGLKHFGA